MPESPEVRIMSDFINTKSENRIYDKIFYVEKGNVPIEFKGINNFKITSESFGKELNLNLSNKEKNIKFSIFMGMSGNWKFVPTEEWNSTKFIRMRVDSMDGSSLILHGGYMGPKYKLGGFKGIKRGPDSVKNFNKFKENIISNLDKKDFNVPICEALLNQKYFNGIGNYIRSTILYYMDRNPFQVSRDYILNNPSTLDMCKEVQVKSYNLGGGQLKDWNNPFHVKHDEFKKWVFYQKGICCIDKTGRTFWFDPKWKTNCPYIIK